MLLLFSGEVEMKSRGRKRLIQLEKHLKDNLSTEVDTTPRIGLLPRNVFIGCTLVLATCCAGGLYWLQVMLSVLFVFTPRFVCRCVLFGSRSCVRSKD